MMTTSGTQRFLIQWLSWLKNNFLVDKSPNFMIYCSQTDMAAITTVFTDSQIRLCHRHILWAMRNKAHSKISLDRSP